MHEINTHLSDYKSAEKRFTELQKQLNAWLSVAR
jgi:hypothetical protein